jgi:outer membrane lipoprotein SlyB
MERFRTIRAKWRRGVIRVYCGDFGANQSAEVGGLIGVAVGIGTALAGKAGTIADGIITFFNDKLPP